MTDGIPYIDYLPNNFDEALATLPQMKARCVDCAYTAGTTASLHPTTRDVADNCVESKCAFFCHKSIDGEFATHLCAGWIELCQTPAPRSSLPGGADE